MGRSGRNKRSDRIQCIRENGFAALAALSRSEIYIDKTGLLSELNKMLCTTNRCVAVSHARRFGKTQAANMIEAYYSFGCDSRELFSEFKIAEAADFDKHLNKYNVIHLDISSFTDYANADVVDAIVEALVDDFSEEYENVNYSLPLHRILYKLYKITKRQFVIIIDEWDCVIRNYSDRQDLVHKYMQFLHSLFKSMEVGSFLALGYVTGILPIKKIDDESALNNFMEYTMLDSKNLTPYYGFTEDEVKELCVKYDMSFDAVKNWYNGYLINEQHMYNPNSVSQSMSNHDLCSYWKNTSSFGTINNYITLNFDGLRESIIQVLAGESVQVDVEGFSNDLSQIGSRDEALTALIHLGYLAYDEQKGRAYLPNYEVRSAYRSALAISPWKEIAGSVKRCEELLSLTIDGDEEKVAELIELKYDKSADSAIDQIKEKRYTSALAGYEDVVLVGINYDKDGGDKKHSCKIERYSKL